MSHSHMHRTLVLLAACMLMGACATGPQAGRSGTGFPVLSASNSPLLSASAGPVELGKAHFKNGDYGLSEKHFRKAAESEPNNGKAWIGLAASYDRLHRWKLADRAYKQAVRIEGKTPAIMNNWGYSKMLRGDLSQARKYLVQAQRQDPQNPHINNNLALLDTGGKLKRRRAGA